jgi:hypothetical protein
MQHVRHSQNGVGQRYRDKLLAAFEDLQEAVRLDDDNGTVREEGDGSVSGAVDADHDLPPDTVQFKAHHARRAINKARVLTAACERVDLLYRQWEAVTAERDALRRELALEGR